MLLKHWTYDPRQEAYVFGVTNDGGGVFKELDNKWYGNSVITCGDIICFGPYETMIEAQTTVEQDYDKRTKES